MLLFGAGVLLFMRSAGFLSRVVAVVHADILGSRGRLSRLSHRGGGKLGYLLGGRRFRRRGLNNLGRLEWVARDNQTALVYQKRAHEAAIATLGETHPLVANTHTSLGSTLWELEDYAGNTQRYTFR